MLALTMMLLTLPYVRAATFTPDDDSACSYFSVVSADLVPDFYDLDLSFYKKAVLGTVPCVGSDKVKDEALLSCAKITSYMVTMRPDVAQGLIKDKIKFVVMAQSEVTGDVPEHKSLLTDWPGTDWNKQRGLGASRWRRAISAGEENLLCMGWPADVYRGEMILVHEFGHAFIGTDLDHTRPTASWWAGYGNDGDLMTKMTEAYDVQVTTNGLWPNTYADDNNNEYFAEGVQAYFDCDQTGPSGGDGIHNDVNTRRELESYDNVLFKLIDSAFNTPDGWRPTCGCSDTDRRDYPLDEFRAECWVDTNFPKDDDSTLAQVLAENTSPGDRLHGVQTCFEAAAKGACVEYQEHCECACATAACPADITIPRDGDVENCKTIKINGQCGEGDNLNECACACSGEGVEIDPGREAKPFVHDMPGDDGDEIDPAQWFQNLTAREKEIFFVGAAVSAAVVFLLWSFWFCFCRRKANKDTEEEKMVQMSKKPGKKLTKAQMV
ncbi:hypothetical protein TrVE_jg6905 [Triparma verrucosa]|uniref:Uncharacterized protein n=1 Tax=Triparma verrucosa TaxID=1606542 RepID=A0A9W7BFZ0_9STRA|nr:hypothetical protein TrVE_jg6905 [Triparma verrucosa]